MNIIEVKNNLVKLCYEDNLILSGFIKITDSQNSYIAQVLHLEATRVGKIAVAKIIFKYNNGISAYDGSIPSLRATVETISSDVLLNNLEHTNPLNLCNLAQQNNKLLVDFDFLKDNPIICAEKFFATKVLLNNIALQLQARKQKLVVFDTTGVFKSNKLTVSKDFKLPLNTSGLNYIYEKGFEDATEESKALIQNIFEELDEYSKTVPFIPFDTFKSVIDGEFARTRLIQLIILKNKIKQIGDWGVFAQQEKDFEVLKNKLKTENTVIIDISCLQESLQKECIKYTYSILKEINTEFYAFTPLTNGNSDKFILQQINETENVHTSIICGYDYNYLNELKKCSKNMLMFTPLKQQKDFGGYNIFLQKMAEDEFIAYGKMTKFIPLIAKLHPLTQEEIYVPHTVEETPTQIVEETPTQIVEEPPVQAIETPITEATPEPQIIEEASSVNEFEEDDDNEEEITTASEDFDVIDETEEDTEDEDSAIEELTVETEEVTTQEIDEIEAPVIEETTVEVEESEAPANEVEQALNEVPDMEDEEELSDDDLDMIEEMSKPDEEIEAINPPQVEEVAEPIAEPIVEAPTQPEEIANAELPEENEPLQTRANTTPSVPVYPSDIPEEDKVNSDPLQEGDRVMHQEFGEGVVEKMINYGDKMLCSINFASVGRRLLNPEISEMKKI